MYLTACQLLDHTELLRRVDDRKLEFIVTCIKQEIRMEQYPVVRVSNDHSQNKD
jgi:hypothetical protein